MANGFSKEEKVMFDDMLEGFDDALVVSRMAKVTKTDQQQMERTGDIIWFPQPYIMTSYSGNDASANFKDVTQLSVPASINSQRHVPWILTARELRDAQQEGRLKSGANQKLSSDINVDLMNTTSLMGSLVVKRTTAASGFDDVALADALFTEQGIPRNDRVMGLSPRDYNNMASNLASRVLDNSKSLTAYEKASIGDVSGFNTYKMDYAYRLTAAAGVTVTITNSQPLFYTPAATTVGADGVPRNVDNRYQTISINVTSGTVKVGDCFTIAGVNAVHHVSKGDTGQLKTFRVTAIISGGGGSGTIQISPPIIAADSTPTQPELEYKNVTATPAAGAAITWLNTVAGNVLAFWDDRAIELLPGRNGIDPEMAGAAFLRGTTELGIDVIVYKYFDIDAKIFKYRADSRWGVGMTNPEMCGIEMFSQT